jgi:hypothetical protein
MKQHYRLLIITMILQKIVSNPKLTDQLKKLLVDNWEMEIIPKLIQESVFCLTVTKIVFLLVNIAKVLYSNDLAQLNNDNLADIRANTEDTAEYTFDTRVNTDNLAANTRNSAINTGFTAMNTGNTARNTGITAVNTHGILEGGRELYNRFGETNNNLDDINANLAETKKLCK